MSIRAIVLTHGRLGIYLPNIRCAPALTWTIKRLRCSHSSPAHSGKRAVLILSVAQHAALIRNRRAGIDLVLRRRPRSEDFQNQC